MLPTIIHKKYRVTEFQIEFEIFFLTIVSNTYKINTSFKVGD